MNQTQHDQVCMDITAERFPKIYRNTGGKIKYNAEEGKKKKTNKQESLPED